MYYYVENLFKNGLDAFLLDKWLAWPFL